MYTIRCALRAVGIFACLHFARHIMIQSHSVLHCTGHTTHHRTCHFATFATMFLRARSPRRNCTRIEQMRPNLKNESGKRKWQNGPECPLAPRPVAAYHRSMLHFGRREFLKVGGG